MTEEQMRQALEGKFFRGPSSFQARQDLPKDDAFEITTQAVEVEVRREVEVEKPLPSDVAVKPPPRYRIPTMVVMKAVAQAHNLTPEDMIIQTGPKRSRAIRLVRARQHFCWLVRKLRPDISLPQIGVKLNYSDHTTVMYHIKQFDARRREFMDKIVSSIEYIEEKTGRGTVCELQ